MSFQDWEDVIRDTIRNPERENLYSVDYIHSYPSRPTKRNARRESGNQHKQNKLKVVVR
jgi:hypothetical protein